MSRTRTRIGLWASPIALIFVMATVTVTHGFSRTQDEAPSWMKQKLEHSTQILEGLATANFDKILINAEKMEALNQMEAWDSPLPPEYQAELKTFRAATQKLINESQSKNVDGAALAFVQMTISCVDCHKVVRGR